MGEPLENHSAKNTGSFMIEPLVSIIIPSFNYAHLIVETLESIIKQRYANWECIIVDDGSTDHTAVVVRQFIAAHPGYHIIFHPVKNGGTSAAKNTGIALSKGKYLQFLDADDLLSEDKLSIQADLAERFGAGLVFSKADYFVDDAAGRNIVQKYPEGFLAKETLKDFALFKRIIVNNVLTINSPLVEKKLIVAAGMFDPELKNNEDWMLWFKVALLHPHFIFDGDDRSAALIRLHGNSAINNKKNMFLGEVVVRTNIDAALSQLEVGHENTYLKRLNLDLLALHEVRSLQISKGLRYIFSSFAGNPLHGGGLLMKGMLRLGIRLYRNVR
ncbi:glycosyltransferase [Pedobacter petrophilus]|uniref:Glycosyltransferase n=1 Tax=Pedobacter petrophilus TaxID=1908241 RepID=A0A7K0FYN1_9SPHI|nr:glycosyltransferase family 2 protein [Pedobacter petrophilus]MRX76697.1 glycosyltransferase [Pedobacter petrophilus]